MVFTEAEEVAKLRVEVDDKSQQLQSLVNGLSSESMELRQTVQGLEGKFKQMDERMERYEDFTKKFMDALPSELEEIGKAVLSKRIREGLE